MNEEIKDDQGLTEKEFLAQYNPKQYPGLANAVDLVIFTVDQLESSKKSVSNKELKVLLIKRGRHPHLGKWALPGGFVNPEESLDLAADRELKEETNIEGIYKEQLYTWGDLDRNDPRPVRIISNSYLSLIPITEAKAGDDAIDAKWFTVKHTVFKKEKNLTKEGYTFEKWVKIEFLNGDINLSGIIKIIKTVKGNVAEYQRVELERSGIAFDHAKIIEYGLERIRNKVEYTDIAFSLMPEKFTLAEVWKTYECILGVKIDRANFVKKIKVKTIGTGEKQKDVAFNPAELYIYNPNWNGEEDF